MCVEYWRAGLQKGVCHMSPVAIDSSTQEHWKSISLELLAWLGTEVNNFLTHIAMGDKKHNITTIKYKKDAIDGGASCEFPSEQEIQSWPSIRSDSNSILEYAGSSSCVPYAQNHHHRSMR